jgi:hypothetical protein
MEVIKMNPTIKINLFDNISIELPNNYYTDMKLDKITGKDKDTVIKTLVAGRYRVCVSDVEIIESNNKVEGIL